MLLQQKLFFYGFIVAALFAAPVTAKGPAYTKPKQAAEKDKGFAIQGEYLGTVDADGEEMKVGAQVVALGQDKFQAVVHIGGLPGAGANKDRRHVVDGELKDDGTITFVGDQANGIYKDGAITVEYDGQKLGILKKQERKSPTLGMKPPEGAIVLFRGKKTLDNWKDGELDGRLLVQGTTSTKTFGSHKLHIEFRLPYMPEDRGQQRGNSGLYLQGRYEVQMLDSFGLEGKDNECGGIYTIGAPKENMCYPPLTWQTYDVDFTAAEYKDGKVVKNPRISVKHNGVVVHENLELPISTAASPLKPGAEPGPVYLQDHGNPVRYRNIWVVPTS